VFASPYFDIEDGTNLKHIFAGGTRVATYVDHALYFLHSNHLGSTGVVSDANGIIHQSLEYFADGETWIDRAPASPVNGYLFNGKPYDPETSFYDYGQRFYDTRTSLWLGVDPAFLDSAQLAMGRPDVVAVTSYAAHSAIRYNDPDGRNPPKTPAGRQVYNAAQRITFWSPIGDRNGFDWDTLAATGISVSEGAVAGVSAFLKGNYADKGTADAIANAGAGIGDAISPFIDNKWFRDLWDVDIVDDDSSVYTASRVGCTFTCMAASLRSGGATTRPTLELTDGPPSTQSQLTAAAAGALAEMGPGRGPVYGTRAHAVFRRMVDALNNAALSTEVSYQNGQVVKYGTKGSVRVDVVEGSPVSPTAIYDFKTGRAKLTPRRIEQIRSHLPNGGKRSDGSAVPAQEIR
jgi:RHS repeat-associated protein